MVSDAIRDLARLYGFRCFYCGIPVCENSHDPQAELTEDHIIPKSRGGSEDLQNKVPACLRCNQLKGNLTADEFRKHRPAIAQTFSESCTGISLLERKGEPQVFLPGRTRVESSEFANQIIGQLAPRMAMEETNEPALRRRLMTERRSLAWWKRA